MCGIAAIFAYHPDAPGIDRGELTAIRDHMAARGPDGSGEWFSPDGRVALGHRRLSIIDLSAAGAQPMAGADGRHVIVFNGEIYNHRELRRELEALGRVFRSQCDTEVLLEGYAVWGADVVRRLRGMFAFAIWDSLKQELFAARDPFGIKPLYIADDGKTLRVASQVKALLAGGQIDRTPEPAGHVGFFIWGNVPAPFTLYRGIRNLTAGTTLLAKRGATPEFKTDSGIKEFFSPQTRPSTATSLAEALQDSVAHHLIADVPVGVFLSAGLDSTTLAALATQAGGRLKTVTLGFREFRGTPSDETVRAEEIARRYNTDHQTVWVSADDFSQERERLFNAMDQPSMDGVNTYFVSLAARRAGLKVALSGLGGDELFGGYPSFRDVPQLVRRAQPLAWVPGLGRLMRQAAGPALGAFTSPKYASLLEYGGSFGAAYLLRRALNLPWELESFFDREFLKEGLDRLDTVNGLNASIAGLTTEHERVSVLELSFYMRQQLLRDADWAGMAHSLEIRVPLVDVQLTQTVVALRRAGATCAKRDMALSPRVPLPKDLLDRPKTGFTVPVREWLRTENRKSEIGNRKSSERGLRSWAREVHARFVPESERASMLKQPTKSKRVSTTRAKPKRKQRILVFRIGQLGDTVVALPALWVVRKEFPAAEITLLCDRQVNKNYVFAADLFNGSTLIDAFESYPFFTSGGQRLLRPLTMAPAMLRLRAKKFDVLVYLAPSARTQKQIDRDRQFFAALGIHRFIGMCEIGGGAPRLSGGLAKEMAHEADLLLARLASSGIPIPPPQDGCMDLEIGAREREVVANWLAQLPTDGGRRWLGVGPGSKMPAKHWPSERYAEVVRHLIEEHDVWPVVFGGPEDRAGAEQLLAQWGRGHNAAGSLGVRAAAAALGRCVLYVGNDTGTMHLAAAMGVKCVGIFSSRDVPGRWNPYGQGHAVLRSQIECEGCGLTECIERRTECLKRITVPMVLAACSSVLKERASKPISDLRPAAANR